MGYSPWGHKESETTEVSHGQRSLVGYSPWGHKESDTTEVTEHQVPGSPAGSPGVWEGVLWVDRVNGCF